MTEAPALSPYLPDTSIQYAWDSTSLGYLKTCPRLYQYIMIEGWGSREESVHLRFGIEYHKMIEEYHKLRTNQTGHEKALAKVIGDCLLRIRDWDVDTDTPAGNYKNPHTLMSLTIDYLDHYRHDAAETYIKQDGVAAVELSFRFELPWGPNSQYRAVHERDWDQAEADEEHNAKAQPYLLCGHLDQVVDFDGSLYVQDHKTSKTSIGEYYFAQYSPNNQMTLYTLAGKIIVDSPIRGVVIDAAQIKLTEPNVFRRGMTYRTQDQLNEWLEDLRYWLHQAETFAAANYWPMNDTACDKFGGCRFRDVCSKDPRVRKTYLKSNFDKLAPEERWNPLKER